MLHLEQVTKIFNKGKPNEVVAVRDVSLEIPAGSLSVLKGPSGSGKTSLLGLIGCMSRPTAGRIVVGDRDVAKLPERFLTEVRRKTFGFIFQHFHLIAGISVLENIMLPLYPTGMSLGDIRRRAEAIVNDLGLSGRKHFSVQGLSGGEQQRVAIGRALINDCQVVLADEPTAHLDTTLSEELIGILRRLHGEGKTVVIATHDPLVYDRPFVQQVIEMRDGRIVPS